MKRSIQTTNLKTDHGFTSIAAHTVRSLLAKACDVGASATGASPCWDRSIVCTAIFATSWAAENALCDARKQGIKLMPSPPIWKFNPENNLAIPSNQLPYHIRSLFVSIDSIKNQFVLCDSFSPLNNNILNCRGKIVSIFLSLKA